MVFSQLRLDAADVFIFNWCGGQRRLRCILKWISALCVPKMGRKHLISSAATAGGETSEAPEWCSDIFIGLMGGDLRRPTQQNWEGREAHACV